MTEEIWKDIPKLEGEYQASNLGRVRSLDRDVVFSNGIRRLKGRILSPGYDSHGYFQVNIKRRPKLLHRLICRTFLGESNLTVNHINGIKTDNRVENLEYCTISENQLHAYKTGLKNVTNFAYKGDRHPASKLSESQVRDIFNKCKREGKTVASVAREYDVTHNTVKFILIGRNWKHLNLSI